MKKTLAIIGVIVVVGGFIFYLYSRDKTQVEGAVQVSEPKYLIGSYSTTTSSGTYFDLWSTGTTTKFATTTLADSVTINVDVVSASSTAAGSIVFLSVFGSNEPQCTSLRTSRTGGDTNTILKSEINWTDLGSHVAQLAGSQTKTTGTSTLSFVPVTGLGQEYTLVDLNHRCLRIDTAASGTIMNLSITTKGNL